MRLEGLKGQPHAVKCMRAVIQTGRAGTAYLFHGPRGVGKRTAARAFAQALNCEAPGVDGEACEACVPCREIVKGIYPDLVFIAAEGEGERERSFHTGQVSAAINWASRTAHRRRTKVGIMDEVHLMSYEAANHFLKVLEEPPPSTVWILLTAEYHAVLPTIRSRCRSVRFTLLPRAAAAEILQAQGRADAEEAAALSLGRVEEDSGELREAVAEAERIVALAGRCDLPELCALGQAYGRKEKAARLNELLNGLELVCGARLRENPEDSVRWVQALDAVGHARVRFRRYASRTLVDSLGAELALVLGRPRGRR